MVDTRETKSAPALVLLHNSTALALRLKSSEIRADLSWKIAESRKMPNLPPAV